ncbi:hypothetical protein BD410DRAFT_897083 [Rickenella mellea]|uniref:Smr domain-containing protein n=1 Tax=Rickenella mellea TaxID=50990 RepID=A0A4Y7Q8C1_9AGAM|nr:hypothetical protein BD410DRAFT_897083 [Rickenella mellea]
MDNVAETRTQWIFGLLFIALVSPILYECFTRYEPRREPDLESQSSIPQQAPVDSGMGAVVGTIVGASRAARGGSRDGHTSEHGKTANRQQRLEEAANRQQQMQDYYRSRRLEAEAEQRAEAVAEARRLEFEVAERKRLRDAEILRNEPRVKAEAEAAELRRTEFLRAQADKQRRATEEYNRILNEARLAETKRYAEMEERRLEVAPSTSSISYSKIAKGDHDTYKDGKAPHPGATASQRHIYSVDAYHRHETGVPRAWINSEDSYKHQEANDYDLAEERDSDGAGSVDAYYGHQPGSSRAWINSEDSYEHRMTNDYDVAEEWNSDEADLDVAGTANDHGLSEEWDSDEAEIDVTETAAIAVGSEWRKKASENARLRDEYNAKADSAFTAGFKSQGKMFKDRANNYGGLMEQHNSRAATEIFAHHNLSYNPRAASTLNKCDLHGLYVKEAERYTTDHVRACQQAGLSKTIIITGRGNGSRDGDAKLKPAVAEILKRRAELEVYVGVPNDGCITIKFGKTAA